MRIKLIDHRSRTVCVFDRFPGSDASDWDTGRGEVIRIPALEAHWVVKSKPLGRKNERRHEAAQARGLVSINDHPTPHPLKFGQDNEPTRLELPGLTLRWERVTPILDRLAEGFAAGDTLTLTVDQFRGCVR